jgi:hypothetical protein
LYLGMILLDDNKPKPLLNGSQIQKALPGVSGQGFKRIVQAIEEWQIRNSCYSLDNTIDDDERTQTEAQLIDYLVASFPENANSTRTTTC